MPRHSSHSIAFERQVARKFIGGETLHGLAKRHDVSRNLIRIWVSKYDAGTYDDDAKAAELLQGQEAQIAALERLVGRQALKLVRHALDLTVRANGQLALLVRFQWLAGKRAAALISSGPLSRVIVLTKRIQWFDMGWRTTTGQHHHAWLF